MTNNTYCIDLKKGDKTIVIYTSDSLNVYTTDVLEYTNKKFTKNIARFSTKDYPEGLISNLCKEYTDKGYIITNQEKLENHNIYE